MAESLIAFRDGDAGPQGMVGAMHLARGLGNLQALLDCYVKVHTKK